MRPLAWWSCASFSQVVYLGIELVDFVGIVQAHPGEVVGAVASLEVIDDASGEFEVGVIDVVVARHEVGVIIDAVVAVHVPNDCGFDGNGPGTLQPEVEVQVESGLGRPSVGVAFAVGIIVKPAGAGHGFDFEEARLVTVAGEKVGQVDAAEQAEVGGVKGGPALAGVDGPHAFDAEPEDWGHVLVKLYADG